MGNHEFCTECEESDFHRHRPCDPEKVAKVKREREEREQLWERKKGRVRELAAKVGLTLRSTSYGGLEISISEVKL